jgi:DNA polymerase (family 10)
MVRAAAGLFLFPAALARAERLGEALRATGLASEVAVAGGVRRRSEVVDALALVAASERPVDLALAFCTLPEVVEVAESRRPRRPSLPRRPARRARDRPSLTRFPGALSTRPAPPRTVTRSATARLDAGFGSSRSASSAAPNRSPPRARSAIYAALGLAPIPPELREGDGEVEAAESGGLPALVSEEDLRGLIHVHTDASDGREPLETMVAATRDAGYSWVAITDHSRNAGYAGG